MLTGYTVVHQLSSIPITPFLIPARELRGHTMRYLIQQSTMNAHPYSFFPTAIRNEICYLCSQQLAWRPSGTSCHPPLCKCRSHSNFNLHITAFKQHYKSISVDTFTLTHSSVIPGYPREELTGKKKNAVSYFRISMVRSLIWCPKT